MEKNIEKLIHDLPDYITGNIEDRELKDRIKDEIDSNPDFRAEYESMKNTFSFLGETALSEPSPFYFNNLLPNISNRIDKIGTLEVKPDGIFSGWFINVLKFAIPALIIIIGYFLYTQITGSGNSNEQITNDKNEIIREDNPNQNNNNLLSNVDDSTANNESTPEMENRGTDRDVTFSSGTLRGTNNGGNSGVSLNEDELDDIIDESATYPVASDDPEIEAVQDLTSQEQDELLNYLENAQL